MLPDESHSAGNDDWKYDKLGGVSQMYTSTQGYAVFLILCVAPDGL